MNATAEPTNAHQRWATVLQVALGDVKALGARLTEAEAVLTGERCLARLERVVSRFQGRLVKRVGHQLLAVFDQPAAALQAACEMQLRIARLPAIAGLRLTLTIALHHGPMETMGNDSHGLTVQLTARLQQLARPAQILATAALAAALPEQLRKFTIAMESDDFAADNACHPLHLVIWQDMAAQLQLRADSEDSASMPPVGLASSPRLCLRQGSKILIVDAQQPLVNIGRDTQNDFLIAHAHASRRHASIELRGRRFMLLDHSTNGTRVSPQDQPDFHVQAGECLLEGRGRLDFGPLENATAHDSISYEVI